MKKSKSNFKLNNTMFKKIRGTCVILFVIMIMII